MRQRSFIARHPIVFTMLLLFLVVIGLTGYWFNRLGSTTLKPQLTNLQANVQEITTDSLKAELTVMLQNNLPISIQLDSLQYMIAVDGDSFMQGVQTNPVQLRAGAGSRITLPMDAGMKEVMELIRTKQRDSADVYMRTVAYNHYPVIGTRAVSIEINRTIYIPRLPKIEVENVKVDKFNFKEGTLLTTLKITNFNSFPITIKGFSYQFQMGDNIRVKGSEQEDVELKRTGSQELTFPVHLKLQEMGEAAWKLLFESESTPYQLSGVVQVQPELASFNQVNLNFTNAGTMKELKELAKDAIQDKKEAKKEEKEADKEENQAKIDKQDRREERKERKEERQEKKQDKQDKKDADN